MSRQDATATLESAGFVVRVSGDASNPSYNVIAQIPTPGKVKLGSQISITVGESAEQAKAREAADAAAAAAAAEKAAAAEAAAAAAAAADADRGTFQEIDARTWALVTKNPDAHVGEKYVLYGHITQFDTATGTSTFRASTGATEQEHSYDYETNTLVTAPDEGQVADLVQDDLVRMYVKVAGSFSYDTQSGGNTTVPRVTILSHDLLGHDD